MTDTDNTDDLSLLTNTPAQAEYQRYSLEEATEAIGFNMSANKVLVF